MVASSLENLIRLVKDVLLPGVLSGFYLQDKIKLFLVIILDFFIPP